MTSCTVLLNTVANPMMRVCEPGLLDLSDTQHAQQGRSGNITRTNVGVT